MRAPGWRAAGAYQTLNEAKQALIAWAVSHPNTPGMMPWPDRNSDLDFAPYPNAYDGRSDCVTTVFSRPYLLGQLPWRGQSNPCTLPHTGLGTEFIDAQGNKLWYAVSRNLVHDYENGEAPIINPGMINAPHAITPYLRQGGTQSFPWLQVLDRNGNLVSDRVAAVIIAPGNPVGGQDRSAPAPNPNAFLDSFQIGVVTHNNSNYSVIDEDFIMGEDSRNVSATDPTFVQPYNFNDKLVYITIDELMAAVEKRVGEQVRTSLKTYQDMNGYYPYAAQLGTSQIHSGELNITTPLNVLATSGLVSGVLPVDHQSCAYARTSTTDTSLSCTQPLFDAATSGFTRVEYRNSPSVFTSNTLGCTINSGNRCYCTGVGTCSDDPVTPTFVVNCTSNKCSAIGAGSATGEFRIRGGKLTFRSGGCVHVTFPTKVSSCTSSTTNRITCNSFDGVAASSGDIEFGSLLPLWFKTNQWQSYMYYQMTRPTSTTIFVGNKATEAIVIAVGRPIDSVPFVVSKVIAPFAQTRNLPATQCSQLNEYLDSAENVSVNIPNNIYDATSTLRSANYNDQTFVVAP